ncbi:hypothetical protein SAMN05444008_12165 [Cnuella takakiae]|uniref:Uncharacterized protein n=1 Tax=Cnuella takakiae TaxID=1302690 RepID=A0A1M5I4K6_9BACT|nr:hypothetical protein [Cnuella takakiae]OLY91351.1 hypothetical protein BUE76_05130 [Cnuella takakiae]SHG22783.1 hypothetical protein SAMN05444008_12165 [Cnuella takakiae]
MSEQQLSQQESLQLITEMIQKAKKSIHETGTSSILWGSAIAVCGLVNFAERQWQFSIGFDVWLLAMIAIIPQVWISVRESRERKVRTHTQVVLNNVWIVYGLSIFALVFYFNIVPGVTERLLAESGSQVFARNTTTGIETPFRSFIASSGSLLLLLYAIPTLITGLTHRFKPMIIGAVLCYGFFIASLFTDTRLDMLFNGLAAICNWLIPGLILRSLYLKEKAGRNV